MDGTETNKQDALLTIEFPIIYACNGITQIYISVGYITNRLMNELCNYGIVLCASILLSNSFDLMTYSVTFNRILK